MLAELVQGLEVIGQAADVPTAIEAARRLRPDALILDIRMPGGSGLDVLRSVKGSARPPLVIVLTTFASPEHRKIYLDAGADYFFSKSADVPVAIEVLRRLSHTVSAS
jgi:DNA-binding NarL/FixJ family response regulator